MKQLAVIFCLAFLGAAAQPKPLPQPRDTAWKFHGFFGLNTSQTALSNWQGGGQDNLTLGFIVNAEAVYRRDEFEQWTNKLDAQYGMIRQGYGKPLRKNIDQLFVLSKYSSRAFAKSWYWSAQGDYRTQFGPGFAYQGDSAVGEAVSDFNSPGYIQLALGLDYKPTDYFSLTFAPVSGKITVVNRQHLADAGAFGVPEAVRDNSGAIISRGRKIRYEFGGRMIMKFKKDITRNINLDSYVDVFTNYQVKPGNFDVVVNNLLTFKISRYFAATIVSQVLYDDDVIIVRDLDKNGVYDQAGEFRGPRIQALTTLALGLTYKY